MIVNRLLKRFARASFPAALILFSATAAVEAGSPMLQNLQSGEFSSVDDYSQSDKWLIVMIWAHDCQVCEREVDDYHRFHQRHAENDALVLGITLDGDERKPRALEFVARHGLGFDNLIGEPEAVMAYYQIATGSRWVGTPSFLIFGPDGELKAKQAGAVEVEIVENFIAQSQ